MATMSIPISKGVGLFVEVDLDEIMSEEFPAEVYKEILFQGLKQVLNRGFAKELSSKQIPEGAKREENQTRLAAQAEKNVEAMRKNEVRVTGGKKKTAVSGAVKLEAMRIARLLVKDAIKREGKVKVSHVPAKQITELAKALLEEEYGPDIVKQAQATIDARAAEEEKIGKGIDLSVVKADPKLVAAAAEKAEKGKKSKKASPKAVPAKPGRAEQRASH